MQVSSHLRLVVSSDQPSELERELSAIRAMSLASYKPKGCLFWDKWSAYGHHDTRMSRTGPFVRPVNGGGK